ncbi:hypothetical protein EBZ39_03410 [bacterium]|nr:hypothetical protein [bacterium]
MATVVINQPDRIEFKNLTPAGSAVNAPTATFQSGEWTISDNRDETGIIVDVSGPETPILTPADARKLAKWLIKAADELDGSSKKNNKHRRTSYYEQDEQDDYRL